VVGRRDVSIAAPREAISESLAALERREFASLRKSFRLTPELADYVRGSVQFYAVDKPRNSPSSSLPVICAIGINYTQDGRCATELFPYDQGGVGVVRATPSTAAVISVISAFRRNSEAWVSRPASDPPSPMRFYGSPDATKRVGAIAKGTFILILTNVCPLITMAEWKKQPTHISERLMRECAPYRHLDNLYEALGDKIDLWIGHSALGGTRWVWPEFSHFVQRHHISEWLLTANISPRSHLWFERAFRNPKNRLFPWYGPEKASV
jgi:hypothetical protein